MFAPKYNISHQLLVNIKKIAELTSNLNSRTFSKVVTLELEKEARALSTYASTSIEGNPLPLTEVKRLIKSAPQRQRDTEREIINYNKTLLWLDDQVNKIDFNEDLILKIHAQIMNQLLPSAGSYRKHPVVVNNPRTGKTVFLPPDWQDVPILMKELVDFSKSQTELDPLILAGLFHKQFVLIHPFLDGNGRTARLATKVLLARMGLNTFKLFSFENYYNRNVTNYFQQVGQIGNYYDLDIEFTSWLEYFTGGIIDELFRIAKQLDTSSQGHLG